MIDDCQRDQINQISSDESSLIAIVNNQTTVEYMNRVGIDGLAREQELTSVELRIRLGLPRDVWKLLVSYIDIKVRVSVPFH
jgi:hypothetical protein